LEQHVSTITSLSLILRIPIREVHVRQHLAKLRPFLWGELCVGVFDHPETLPVTAHRNFTVSRDAFHETGEMPRSIRHHVGVERNDHPSVTFDNLPPAPQALLACRHLDVLLL
jgi:hypothetical protein